MQIFFGSDHRGFSTKEFLRDAMKARGIQVVDLGTHYPTPADYPEYAQKVAKHIENDGDFGVLICGTGIGMSMAANRFCGIRAALCMTTQFAEMARKHNLTVVTDDGDFTEGGLLVLTANPNLLTVCASS